MNKKQKDEAILKGVFKWIGDNDDVRKKFIKWIASDSTRRTVFSDWFKDKELQEKMKK